MLGGKDVLSSIRQTALQNIQKSRLENPGIIDEQRNQLERHRINVQEKRDQKRQRESTAYKENRKLREEALARDLQLAKEVQAKQERLEKDQRRLQREAILRKGKERKNKENLPVTKPENENLNKLEDETVKFVDKPQDTRMSLIDTILSQRDDILAQLSRIDEEFNAVDKNLENNCSEKEDIVDATIQEAEKAPKELLEIEKFPLEANNNVTENATTLISDLSTSFIQEETTSRRIDRILHFLQDSERHLATPNPIPTSSSSSLDPILDISAHSSDVFEGVKQKIMSQQLEINEKLRTQTLLTAELKKLKEMLKEQQESSKQELKQKLSSQRKEYESIVKRHLNFVDKLLAEKDELTRKGSALAEEVKTLEKQFKEKLASRDEQFSRELKQQKEIWQASEKLRRDKWISEKTKLIKENTVKGLEPEIQRMLAQHKQQARALEDKLKSDFAKEKEALLTAHESQLDQLRSRIVTERDRALEEEREFIRQRYQKQYEQDLFEQQQIRRQLQASFEEQKALQLKQWRESEITAEKVHREAIDQLSSQIGTLKREREDALNEVKRRHQLDMQMSNERVKVEKEEWQTQMLAKMQVDLKEKEKILRAALTKERDADIEMVIQKLENETASSIRELERQHQAAMTRHRTESNTALQLLKEENEKLNDDLTNTRQKVQELTSTVSKLDNVIRSHERTLMERNEVIKKQNLEILQFQRDEEEQRRVARQSVGEELNAKDQLAQSLRQQLADTQSQIMVIQNKHRAELEEVIRQKEETLQMVESRVRSAMASKDEALLSLKRQYEASQCRVVQLEHLLEKQRQELLQC